MSKKAEHRGRREGHRGINIKGRFSTYECFDSSIIELFAEKHGENTFKYSVVLWCVRPSLASLLICNVINMTTRCPSCSQSGAERSNPQGEARSGELVSRNARELDSASLHLSGVASLPEVVKPVIAGEATPESNRRTPRGDWRRRARTEKSRNLRGPVAAGRSPRRESDGLIVASKGLIHLERRGPTVSVQPWRLYASA